MTPALPAAAARGLGLVLLLTACVAATWGFGIYLFPALFGALRAELSLSYATLGVVSGLVQVAIMASAIAAGPLYLRFGAAQLILTACMACAAALLGLAFVSQVWALGLLLVLLAVCAVTAWVPMVELAREAMAPEHRGKALGLISSGTSYGVFVNSLLMVSVLPALGWRWVWAATGVMVALLAWLAWWRLRGVEPHHAATGAPAAGAPVRPLRQRLRELATPTTALLLVITSLDGLACTPFQTYLSALLQGDAGLSAGDAAFAWRLVGLCGMVSGVAIGALADRLTVRRGLVLTHLILALACLGVVNLAWLPGRSLLSASAMAFGAAFYAIYGLMPAYISERYGQGDAALVFAMTNLTMGLGGMAGNLAVGVHKEASGVFTSGYLAMGGTAALAALLCLALPTVSTASVQRPRGGAITPGARG